MSTIITAVYENGVFRPLTPLSIQQGETITIEILDQANVAEKVIQSLVIAGKLIPPAKQGEIEAVSEVSRRKLMEKLKGRSGKSLSEIIIEDREILTTILN